MPKSIENSALVLIAIFLCFGYMTGTDWYNYELFYTDKSLAEGISTRRETGYFFIQSFFSRIGVDFWTFHITLKVLVFIALIYFIRWFNVNVFLFLAFFIPIIGLYLFIDCPFRNLIAFGFSLIAFIKLLERKHIAFFIFVALALLFHISSLFLILVFFIYNKEFKVTFILVATAIVYSVAFNAEFLIQKIYLPLVEYNTLISDRMKGYLTDSKYITDSINLGSFIRLFIIVILVLFKNTIVGGDKLRSYVFNLSIFYLMLYPLGISMKLIQRIALYISPFFVLSVIYLLKDLQIKSNKYLLGGFFIFFTLWQTYSMVTVDYRYVPYSNYLYYWAKKDFPSKEYRLEYNRKFSPYKKKK